MNNLPAIASRSAPVAIQRDGVAQYLLALASLCVEVARSPRLLPVFLHVIARVPSTIEALRTERRRAA
jgi:hypothetical protein